MCVFLKSPLAEFSLKPSSKRHLSTCPQAQLLLEVKLDIESVIYSFAIFFVNVNVNVNVLCALYDFLFPKLVRNFNIELSSGYLITAGGAAFNCSVCGKSFKHQTTLSNHMKCHTGEATCPYCERVLSSKRNLNRHLHTCPQAPQAFEMQ